jgi:hypothetical protein
MSSNYLKHIDAEEANKLYSDAVRKARQLRERAAITATLADRLEGAYITKRLNAILSALPGVERGYIEKSASGRVLYATLYQVGYNGYSDGWSVRLAPEDQKRVDAETVRAEAARLIREAERTEKAIEGFWANVGQLNAIVTAYAQIRRELEPITTDLCYCW